MIDQTSQFFAILTNTGTAKQANADALGIAWKITQMGVGDANGTDPIPSAAQTALINERRRAPLNQLKVDPNNSAIIIAEQVIPEDVGGWWIREIGLYDADGDLVAIANCAPSFKPLLTQGSGRTQVVRMNMIVSNSSNMELKIDPSVVLATRAYVDAKVLEELNKLDAKQSARAATTSNIALSGLQTIDGVVLAAGDRVLVKNQTAGKDNGIYVAASGAWTRSADADASIEVTPSLTVFIEQGTTQTDTLWQLVTDGAIVLGTTVLSFQNITFGFAPLASPAFTGTPTVPTAASGTNTTQAASTAFVRTAVAGLLSKSVAGGVTVNLTAAEAGNAVLSLSGALTANIAVTVPAISGWWIVENKTTGAYTLTVKTPAGTGVVVVQGKKKMVWCDGVNVLTGVDDLDSIALTGTPTAPTAAPGTNTPQLANTAFVQAAVAALVASSPAALDTLNELAAALGNDPNFATTMTNLLAAKAPLASPALTGTPTAPTPARFDATTKLANMAALQARGFQYAAPIVTNGAGLTGVVAHVGALLHFYGASGNSYSLPDTVANSIPAGANIRITNWGGTALNLATQGTDKMQETLDVTASATVRSIPPDAYVDCMHLSSGTWLLTGTGVMGKTRSFGAALAGTGWQKLPSGLIVQWGQTAVATSGDVVHTLPIAFPNVFASVLISQGYTAGTNSLGYASAGVASLGTFVWKGSAVGNGQQFIAVGY